MPDPDDLEVADFTGFHAAHIFPLASEGLLPGAFCNGAGFEEFRTSVGSPGAYQTGLNSVRNGMLLSIELHVLWDGYKISVSPDVSLLAFCSSWCCSFEGIELVGGEGPRLTFCDSMTIRLSVSPRSPTAWKEARCMRFADNRTTRVGCAMTCYAGTFASPSCTT